MKTKLTYRVEYPEGMGGGHDEWSVEKGIWDANVEDIMEMIEALLLAAGWHENTIAAIFGQEDAILWVDDEPAEEGLV